MLQLRDIITRCLQQNLHNSYLHSSYCQSVLDLYLPRRVIRCCHCPPHSLPPPYFLSLLTSFSTLLSPITSRINYGRLSEPRGHNASLLHTCSLLSLQIHFLSSNTTTITTANSSTSYSTINTRTHTHTQMVPTFMPSVQFQESRLHFLHNISQLKADFLLGASRSTRILHFSPFFYTSQNLSATTKNVQSLCCTFPQRIDSPIHCIQFSQLLHLRSTLTFASDTLSLLTIDVSIDHLVILVIPIPSTCPREYFTLHLPHLSPTFFNVSKEIPDCKDLSIEQYRCSMRLDVTASKFRSYSIDPCASCVDAQLTMDGQFSVNIPPYLTQCMTQTGSKSSRVLERL
nr:hypothetical protein HmN_000717700 [Hymenolepis microstoma]